MRGTIVGRGLAVVLMPRTSTGDLPPWAMVSSALAIYLGAEVCAWASSMWPGLFLLHAADTATAASCGVYWRSHSTENKRPDVCALDDEVSRGGTVPSVRALP